jgi:hypothetical protein
LGQVETSVGERDPCRLHRSTPKAVSALIRDSLRDIQGITERGICGRKLTNFMQMLFTFKKNLDLQRNYCSQKANKLLQGQSKITKTLIIKKW